MHVSGVQLNQLSGVAAILRYPLPDLDQLELDAAMYDESNDSDDSSNSDEEGVDAEESFSRVQEDVADMGF
jgi:protein pelota